MTDTFPALSVQGWSVFKAPKFATRIQHGVSGRELRALDQPVPIWNWTLTYEVLRDKHDVRQTTHTLGTGYDELRQIMGFYLKQQGSFGAFLFNDPTDNRVTGQFLATGNGVILSFGLVRSFGGFVEQMFNPIVDTTMHVYVNAVEVPMLGNWSVTDPGGVLTFVSAPTGDVTVDFSYNFLCRFSDDTAEFENFMIQLWSLKTIKFQLVLP